VTFIVDIEMVNCCCFVAMYIYYKFCIQRVSEISTLILTSDSSRQEQQHFYVSFFFNIIFISVFFPPIN
jgi:hypothetical protein